MTVKENNRRLFPIRIIGIDDQGLNKLNKAILSKKKFTLQNVNFLYILQQRTLGPLSQIGRQTKPNFISHPLWTWSQVHSKIVQFNILFIIGNIIINKPSRGLISLHAKMYFPLHYEKVKCLEKVKDTNNIWISVYEFIEMNIGNIGIL